MITEKDNVFIVTADFPLREGAAGIMNAVTVFA